MLWKEFLNDSFAHSVFRKLAQSCFKPKENCDKTERHGILSLRGQGLFSLRWVIFTWKFESLCEIPGLTYNQFDKGPVHKPGPY